MSSVPKKTCSVCGNDFPATPEHFERRACNKSGIGTRCRECARVVDRERYARRNRQSARRVQFPILPRDEWKNKDGTLKFYWQDMEGTG